ncbi:MAG: glutaredoxin 3 [Pseudomonadota bacterium]
MHIEIYTKSYCPYCHRAKRLLEARDLAYTEYDVTFDTAGQREMITRTAGRTVPQIIIDGKPVGGSDELIVLDQTGKLHPREQPLNAPDDNRLDQTN